MGRPRKGGGNSDRRIQFDDDRLIELHESGRTSAEIAALHGCSNHPVKVALRRLGLRRPAKQRKGILAGYSNPAWKGGRRLRVDGYVAIWTPDGERLEHRVVMEQEIGRKLVAGEIVHHVDGDKSNNAISNLKLMTQSEHIREHLDDMHAWRYGK